MIKRESETKETSRENRKMRPSLYFYTSFLLCLLLGIFCVTFVYYWNTRWRGGLAWDDSGLQFNWHPVLMVTGMVVLYGYAAVMYRIPQAWGWNKQPWKLLHATLLLLALLMSVLGLNAVFDFHDTLRIPHLYSLHSWIGISAAALFTVQWVLGLAAFILPCSPLGFRKLLKPIHTWMGSVLFVLSIVSCISGINQKLFFVFEGNSTQMYSSLPPEAVFANSLGVLIVVFGSVVLNILSSQKWEQAEPGHLEDSTTPLLPQDS
ncbi:cytochrome b ascorbate-dependent protein 3-like [Arapaima gigas]